ncbi:MAG: hypothetical protein KA105_00855 [Caulobacter sp.]|nr:hypothetical protein [Caulobacter sp.]
MRLATIALACGALAITACNRKAETAQAPAAQAPVAAPVAVAPSETHLNVPVGFRHDAAFDASGYYLATQPVQVGDYRLTHVGVGAPSDFAQWEDGQRASVFGPILFQFEDVTSPMAVSETGAETHTINLKVLPQAYAFAPGKMTFRGTDPKLGEIVFEGSFDQAALDQARNEGSSASPVLRGKLKVGSGPVRDVAMAYVVGA